MSRYAWTGGSALRETIGEITARAVDCLAADRRIQLLFHFGSSARADSPEPRDVDLAILTRPALSLRELLVLQGEIQEACGVPIDLVDLNDAPVVLAHEVVEGGRCLFSRSPDEETEFVTRTRMRWWDWLPVREEQWRLAGRRLEERLGSQT